MNTCRSCGSTHTIPYTARPPRPHNGPCTTECDRAGRLCLNCRLLSRKETL